MRVPLPPRQAPRETAHQRGVTSTPLLCMVRMSGMRVATKGMLSRNEETMADTHRMSRMVMVMWPLVRPMRPLARTWMMPVSCRPPTTTNRPVKKRMVVHSTPVMTSSMSWCPMSSMTAAAVRAMVQDSRPSWAWKMKPRTTSTMTTTLLMSRGRSLIAFSASRP